MCRVKPYWVMLFLLVVSLAWAVAPRLALAGKGQLEIRAVDKDTGKPIAVRMHLKDQRGKPVKPPKVPYWKDHFVFEGKLVLELSPGAYTFEMERGPEYRQMTGHFIIENGAADNKEVTLSRFIDMKKEGWWSGDLHLHRSPAEIQTLMLAEDLYIAPLITWSGAALAGKEKPPAKGAPQQPVVQFGESRFYSLLAGEDDREGADLLFFDLKEPLPLLGSKREYPSPFKFIDLARENPAAHIDLAKPFCWDMPTLAASGKIHSLGLANSHQQRDGVQGNEAGGKPRDTQLFPDPHGNGRWSMKIYYDLLNAGVRLPPSAGSGSGESPNPVGYNRVYVHCGPELTWEKWWAGLRAGKVVVTNGPLLQPRVTCTPQTAAGPDVDLDGALPGHVFQVDQGRTVELNIALNLSTRDKIEYLEVVQNGKVVHEVRLDQWAKAGGKLPAVKFDQSGWMLVRAMASNGNTYRFATTGPYYVEVGYNRRVSKQASQFFLDWVIDRARHIKLEDESQRKEVLEFHRQARDFWKQKVDQANAE